MRIKRCIMYPLDDTIAAIASPPGGAARGILRISGPRAIECLTRFFQTYAPLESPFPHAIAGSLRLPELHSPLPCDAYVWPNARSYTGQPVAEIHTLGSPPLLELVLRSLSAAGARLAGPGEFTLRAFLAGRIDLTQAEAVLGVIDADNSRELKIALGQLAGGLARPLHRLRDALLNLLAHVEAGFDFADENLAFISREELDRQLAAAENDVASIRRQVASRGESSHSVRAVLVGRPNAGKSSLFNAMAGLQAALVSEHPGTTRDYLVAELDLDGVKCRLIDTAGERGRWRGERKEGSEGWAVHRPSNSAIEQAAHSAAAAQRRGAHLEVLCLDSTRPLDDWDRGELAAAKGRRIVVLTKCDGPRRTDCTHAALETSSLTGEGIAALRGELRRQALAAGEHRRDVVAGTAVRSADSLRLASQCLWRARQVASAGQEELAAAEIRAALEELGKVVGAVYTEDVLDRIFSRFCVGK
jgi:tRNA modification GTPase